MSRSLLVIFASIALACCTTSAINLRNPATRQTAKCGPYYIDAIGSHAQADREARCIDDYHRQGFERVPG